ncbi:MAG: hypothetical protein MHM6MM_009353 [Cercozoa sp. M6MM]
MLYSLYVFVRNGHCVHERHWSAARPDGGLPSQKQSPSGVSARTGTQRTFADKPFDSMGAENRTLSRSERRRLVFGLCFALQSLGSKLAPVAYACSLTCVHVCVVHQRYRALADKRSRRWASYAHSAHSAGDSSTCARPPVFAWRCL